MMKFTDPKCPKCKSDPGSILESVLVMAELTDPIMEKDAILPSFDYAGESEVCWDTQEPHSRDGMITLACSQCGQEWETEFM